jgi:phospholipid transport system substrate-binding protein
MSVTAAYFHRRIAQFGANAVLPVLLMLGAIAPARAADPAVVFMDRVTKDLMVAVKTQSPATIAGVIQRYGDVPQIGLYALGDYRPKLEEGDKSNYYTGMVKFISRYAAKEAPKYPVESVTFAPESRTAKYGLTVDSTVKLADGSSYEVSWLLIKAGNTYRVRDAQAAGFWMTPFLKRLFEAYVAENSGNVKSLVAVLNR